MTQERMSPGVWFDMSNIAIRLTGELVVPYSVPPLLENPLIICNVCKETLTTLADYDTVAALMTLGQEHFANDHGIAFVQELREVPPRETRRGPETVTWADGVDPD